MKNKKLLSILFLSLLSTSLLIAAPVEGTTLLNQNIISTLFGAFVAGLFLTFTPCVLPMIPILSSIIAGQGKDISKTKAVGLSVSYVLGTAVTYAIMGALAGATGEQLQSYFQNVWFIGAVSAVFILMALSMFGLFIVELPSFIQSRLNEKSQNLKGGSSFAVFLLGMVTALILGACVSPILISFLSIAISTGDSVLGALTMFFMALGMGVPLVILGFGAGHILPHAGGWMDNVKYVFGVLLLAVAIYIFSTLELFPVLLLWGVLFIGVSIYLGALSQLQANAKGWNKLLKATGIILLIWGTFLLIGGAYGENNVFKPLPKLSINYTQNKSTDAKKINVFPFETIGSMAELKIKQNKAKDENKLLIIYFYMDTCPVCKKLKATTLIDSDVLEQLEKNYISIKVNMTDKTDLKSQEVKDYFSIFGPPAFVFFNTEGEELEDDAFYGYKDPSDFLDIIEMIAE